MRPRVRSSRAGLSTLAAVIAVATAATLAGCGSDTDDAAQSDGADTTTVSPSPTDEESDSKPASPSPTTKPDPTTSEFTPLAPKDAADGTDVDACADSKCEVAVTAGTTIPFDPDIGGVTIADVGKSQVTLAMTYPSGGSGSIQTGVGPQGGSFGNVNTTIIEFGVLGIKDGTAVVSFAPEEP
ncbi:hypothetical protein [Streptomyces phytophilus]|uniref:hypothetical protein n=1 Tax=Streptomyces phytophilus TaxID=722715 RepID=UPI0015EFF1E1|nr:hypothetical protein [Streptomyces phytophilus]